MKALDALQKIIDSLYKLDITVATDHAIKIPVLGPYLITGTWHYVKPVPKLLPKNENETFDFILDAISTSLTGFKYTRLGSPESLKYKVESDGYEFVIWFKHNGELEIEPLLPDTERPMTCAFCHQQLYYRHDPNWVPEAEIKFSGKRSAMYAHTGCLDHAIADWCP